MIRSAFLRSTFDKFPINSVDHVVEESTVPPSRRTSPLESCDGGFHCSFRNSFCRVEVKMEFLSSFSKRSDESRQIGAKTQTDVPSRILFLWTTAQIEQEIASLVRLLFTQCTDSIIVRIVIIVLCCQHVWFQVSHVLTNCIKLTIWCVTDIQKTDSAFVRQVVCRCWSYLHCLVICEITAKFVVC